jgi:hypothetical protein
MRNIFLVFLVSFFCLGLCNAQTVKPFSNNPAVTVSELNNFFESVPKEKKNVSDALMKRFPAAWNQFTDKEQLVFIDLANAMLKKRLYPVPNFSDFIETYIAFVNSDQSDGSEKAFVKCLYYDINASTNQFSNAMNNYRDVMEKRLLNVFTGTSWWVREAETYYFEFDSIPKIVFPKMDLVAENGKDSIVISNTSGYYLPHKSLFVGKKGTVDWTKAGQNASVYATFENYTANTRSLRFSADSALYHNNKYFTKPQLGVLEDKVMTVETDEEKATYPRFSSYKKNIRIENIYPEVDFLGGVQVRGARFLGSGDAQNLASLVFKKEGKEVIWVHSASITMKENQALSALCMVTIYIEKDSIYHSAIQLRYDTKDRELWLMRGKNGSERMPFFNTYHNLEMYSDALHWKLKEENIEFCPLPGPADMSTSTFESSNYFEPSRVEKMMGMSQVNPLWTLYEFFRTTGKKKASVDEIVRHFGYSKSDVQTFLFECVEYGLIDFNMLTSEIFYRQKLGNYLQNDVRRKDYDILTFNSNLKGNQSNATLSMLNYDLTIKGLEYIVVSDAQIVNIFPTGRQIVMQKNRDFLFHGRVRAGLFDFCVSNSKFSYDGFKMDFTVIDSMVLFVEDKSMGMNAMEEYPLVQVRSYIQDISGTLYIDRPNNKSSMLDIPGYPYFEAKSPGKVFYDHPFVYNGAYERERFYFQLDLFTIKDLDDFDTDSLLFTGYLNSGGIFPNITKPLKVRPDFSLGFIYHTPSDGLPAYQGRGTFTNKIDLSNLGLRCTGKLDYTQSHGEGKDMLFFLDSMNAYFDTYRIDAMQGSVEYPPVTASNVYAHWEPYSDKMYVNSQQRPFRIYDEARLNGQLVVSYSGVKGSGTMKYNIAEMQSNDYTFLHHELNSPSMSLFLYDSVMEDYHLKAYNLKGKLDFDKRKGNFIVNEGVQAVFFPINQYKTYATEFDWLVDDKKLLFKYEDPYATADIPNTEIRDLYEMKSAGNELISTHPAQDSLHFVVSKATYDFKKYEILAEGVRFIEVADAAIFPQNGIVKIYRRAEIERLNNSKVLANTDTKLHEIFKANIDIGSRKIYNGTGFYNYIDENKKKQEIFLDSIYSRKSLTKGRGNILTEYGFTLNPHFGYYGNVMLNAEDKFLTLNGFVSLLYDCGDTITYAPLRYNGLIDPDSVLIPINNSIKDTNRRLVVAAIASTDKGRIYPAFARAKFKNNDPEYISAEGFLTYNKDLESYIVASAEKIADLDLEGNILYLDKINCIAKGEGKLDIGSDFGRVSFIPMGSIVNFMREDSAIIKISAAMDFFFNDDCMKMFADKIESAASLEGLDISECQNYHIALKEILSNKEYQKYYPELKQNFHFSKLPKSLQLNLVLADVQMVWNQDAKTFVNQGQIGIAICGKREVNRYVPGIIEILKKSSNRGGNNKSDIKMYFEIGEDWFYFEYAGSSSSPVMRVLSSIKAFNDCVESTPDKKKTLESDSKNNLPSYKFTKATLKSKKKFVEKYAPKEEGTE